MDQSKRETVECFVVFTKSKTKHWIFKLIDSEIQHAYIMKKSEGGQIWTIINPLFSHTKIDVDFVDRYPHPRIYAGEDAVIVPVKTDIDITTKRWTFCVFNCVEVVKSVLGIKSFWTWTPYQLYKKISEI